jgi:hypothetical protein
MSDSETVLFSEILLNAGFDLYITSRPMANASLPVENRLYQVLARKNIGGRIDTRTNDWEASFIGTTVEDACYEIDNHFLEEWGSQ